MAQEPRRQEPQKPQKPRRLKTKQRAKNKGIPIKKAKQVSNVKYMDMSHRTKLFNYGTIRHLTNYRHLTVLSKNQVNSLSNKVAATGRSQMCQNESSDVYPHQGRQLESSILSHCRFHPPMAN